MKNIIRIKLSVVLNPAQGVPDDAQLKAMKGPIGAAVAKALPEMAIDTCTVTKINLAKPTEVAAEPQTAGV